MTSPWNAKWHTKRKIFCSYAKYFCFRKCFWSSTVLHVWRIKNFSQNFLKSKVSVFYIIKAGLSVWEFGFLLSYVTKRRLWISPSWYSQEHELTDIHIFHGTWLSCGHLMKLSGSECSGLMTEEEVPPPHSCTENSASHTNPLRTQKKSFNPNFLHFCSTTGYHNLHHTSKLMFSCL